MSGMCAACGQPGHRYGRNEGMERFDRQACINGLVGKVGQLEGGIIEHMRTSKGRPSVADMGLWGLVVQFVDQEDDRG